MFLEKHKSNSELALRLALQRNALLQTVKQQVLYRYVQSVNVHCILLPFLFPTFGQIQLNNYKFEVSLFILVRICCQEEELFVEVHQ